MGNEKMKTNEGVVEKVITPDSRIDKQADLDALIKRVMDGGNKERLKSTLNELARTEPELLIGIAVSNENSNDFLLEGLSEVDNPDVRAAVASNENSSGEVLGKLMNDEYVEVRLEVAGNPSTPFSILTIFTLIDSSDEVKERAVLNPSIPADFRVKIASSSSSVNVLRILAGDKDPLVRAAVGANENAPTGVLKDLSKNLEQVVRWSVGGNRNTPSDVLRDLSGQGGLVSLEVSANRSTPPDVLTDFVQNEKWSAGVKGNAIRNSSTPLSVRREALSFSKKS